MLIKNRPQMRHEAEKTFQLLALMAAGSENLHIGDLANKLQLSRNEVLRLLVSLENQGMAHWDDGTKTYRPIWKPNEMKGKPSSLGRSARK